MTTTTITITDGTAWFEDGTTVHCTVQQIKALPTLLRVMKGWAEPYVAKGLVEHAYDGCAVSGERALAYINDVLILAGVREANP